AYIVSSGKQIFLLPLSEFLSAVHGPQQLLPLCLMYSITMPGALLEAVLQCRGKAWYSPEPVRWEGGNAAEEWYEQAYCLYGSGSSRGLPVRRIRAMLRSCSALEPSEGERGKGNVRLCHQRRPGCHPRWCGGMGHWHTR